MVIKKHILKFIDSFIVMKRSLSSLSDNLAEIHDIKWPYRHTDQKCKECETKYKIFKCYLEYNNFEDNKTRYKSSYGNRKYQKEINNDLIKRFWNAYRFCNQNNKFILLLRKGPYHFE